MVLVLKFLWLHKYKFALNYFLLEDIYRGNFVLIEKIITVQSIGTNIAFNYLPIEELYLFT